MTAVTLGLAALQFIPGPAADPTPSPTVAPPSLFTSPLNAYSFQLPSGWRAAPASMPWPEGEPIDNGDAEFLDVFIAPASGGSLYIASQPLPGDPTVWIRDQQETMGHIWPVVPTCPVPFNSAITVDGAGGLFDSSCKANGLRAWVRTTERGYAFILRADLPEEWFKDLLATVDLAEGGS